MSDTPAPSEASEIEILDQADTTEAEGELEDGRETVNQPQKLIRIASMVRNMLEEVRRAPLDDAGRQMLRQIHDKSLHELEDVLSADLRDELAEVVLPFTQETPSESELRIAQAQLVGWLEGLFHGIQASMFSQQMAAQAQMEQMRRRALMPGMPGGVPGDGIPGEKKGSGYL